MRPLIFGGGVLLTIWWVLSIPSVLFNVPYSTVTESRDGRLLGARIATDGQWRFPKGDSIPFRFSSCIVAFEDERFFSHPGVDPISMSRAIWQNISNGKVVSGGSTISMQVIRLSRNNPPRTYFEKLTEILRATRLEASYSKEEILSLYVAHAPFGGNVVGLEAAAWRYYSRPAYQLSWAECAALAVLPNAPSDIRPDKNRGLFLEKRNRLLATLLEKNEIDSITYRLSLTEALPQDPSPLPDLAHHLTERQREEMPNQRFKSTLDFELQRDVQRLVDLHSSHWIRNGVNNSAVLVVDVESGDIHAYVGNTRLPESDANNVDMLNHPRSTGSILKPMLYALAMEAGMVGPKSIIADIPTRFGDFTPKNFDKSYAGAVTVEHALQSSLNIPSVRTLRKVGVPVFQSYLRGYGMKDIRADESFYGLSLILGGAEVRPTQIAQAYRRWILTAMNTPDTSSHDVFGKACLQEIPYPSSDPSSVFMSLHMMEGVNRPSGFEHLGMSSGRRIAWKTGTSFGFRDAWAVGTDGRWLVVTWTGNANSEGRPGVIGVETSAPLFFKVMSLLPAGTFPLEPYDDQMPVRICVQSGYAAQANCEETDTAYTGVNGIAPCPYCERIQLNEGGERVDYSCASGRVQDTGWMMLPGSMAWYALQSGFDYTPPPAWSNSCAALDKSVIEWVYPELSSEVVKRTRDVDGKLGPVILEAGHRTPNSQIFWYVDGEFIETTQREHRIEAVLAPGSHTLYIVDDNGNSASNSITVVE